jgi:hypothetical protein
LQEISLPAMPLRDKEYSELNALSAYELRKCRGMENLTDSEAEGIIEWYKCGRTIRWNIRECAK